MKKRKGSLRTSLMGVSVILFLVIGVVNTAVAYVQTKKSVHSEVSDGMKNMIYIISNSLDAMYPGEYDVAQSGNLMALKKGDTILDSSFLESIKTDTGLDITIFYGAVRMLTTIKDENGQSLAGTKMNAAIRGDVLENDQPEFYSNVLINKQKYFAYYMPIHSGTDEVIGAFTVLKDSSQVDEMIFDAVIPIIAIIILACAAAEYIVYAFFKNIRNSFDYISKFLSEVEKGHLAVDMNEQVYARNDEIGELAQNAVAMKRSIKQLIEYDALTGLYNRRYANERLRNMWLKSAENGSYYSLAIGDIDFFKKINDTYGHDCGDKVLTEISGIMKKYMAGKGFAARWGGEEFLLVFDNKEINEAQEYVVGLLELIRKKKFVYEDIEFNVTMSFGVTSAHGLSIEKSLVAADNRLYQAKESGRNRVIGYDQ